MKVFVYGSLKRGLYNHPLLEKATFVSSFTIPKEENLGMLNLGAFPGVIRMPQKNTGYPIHGEIYDINEYDETTLKNLDFLEGHPNFYERKTMKFSKDENMYIYILPQQYLTKFKYPLVTSGKWPIIEKAE